MTPISVFDLFKVGIGPSSSHTVGPMRAALRFAEMLESSGCADRVARVQVELFGSLALTGRGHATDKAVVLGLLGERPDTVEPDGIEPLLAEVRRSGTIALRRRATIPFSLETDIVFRGDETLPRHPNALRITAWAGDGSQLLREVFYSVGGGFVVREADEPVDERADEPEVPFPFASAAELLAVGRQTGLTIAEIVRRNEAARRDEADIDARLDRLWHVMKACIDRGCRTEGVLPGGLGVPRRAPTLFRALSRQRDAAEAIGSGPAIGNDRQEPAGMAGGGASAAAAGCKTPDPLQALDWVSLWALAVNEENAAGGRVVTAPTNGAAGVVPAVLAYACRFLSGSDARAVRTFLLTAGAIGMLFKRNASLSGAEVGCQGEVGVACSMAAAGLAAVMGGTNEQIENAAEIGMEHHLGLTCDPVAGLVQVPCIERNAMGAATAINAARLAVLYGDGRHRVSLDQVIETMRQTGLDMQSKYKETSRGGLALNVVDC